VLSASLISVAADDDALVLRLRGEHDVTMMPRLRGTLAAVARTEPSALGIDLTESLFLCVSGMGALLVLRAGLLQAGADVRTLGGTMVFRGLLAEADRVGLPWQRAKPPF
jgi:hypothetical protein